MISRAISTLLITAAITIRASFAAECPISLPEVSTWRDSLLLGLPSSYDREFGIESAKLVLKCKAKNPELFKLPSVAACMTRMETFLTSVSDVSITPLEKDKTPYDEIPDARASQIPDDLQDQKFLKLVSNRKTLKDAKAYIENLNRGKPETEKYTYLQYTSQFVVSPDESASPDRLVVFVPGNSQVEPDRWVLFSVSQEGNPLKPNLVSVISVQKKNSKGKSLDQKIVRFQTHWREYKKDSDIKVSALTKPMPHEMKCYSCHKLGVRSILPDSGSVSTAETPFLEKMNEIISNYGTQTYGGVYNPESWGPPMGIDSNSSPTTSLNFNSCVTRFLKDLSPRGSFSVDRVTKAAACTSCHNGKPGGVGVMNFPMGGMGSDGDQVNAMITHLKKMPPGANLSAPEREALSSCLLQSYYSGIGEKAPKGQLAQWLTSANCETAVKSSTPGPKLETKQSY